MVRLPLLIIAAIGAIALTLALPLSAAAVSLNGFAIDDGLIEPETIKRGGPPKDGIPALDSPAFIEAGRADFLDSNDRILGLIRGGVAKAYPVKILNWHEVVNDEIAGDPVVITYCPLCGTGMAFSGLVDGEHLEFGVSGLLYNSDVLLYDRGSESLWSQLMGRGVTGRYAGTRLEQQVLHHTTWQRWLQDHPQTLVLSADTGYNRNYATNPYRDYALTQSLYFPVEHRPEGELHMKETVLGVSIDGRHKAYPFSRLEQYGRNRFADTVGDRRLTVVWDEEGRSAQVLDEEGRMHPTVQGFWFAWYAFHPDTEVFTLP